MYSQEWLVQVVMDSKFYTTNFKNQIELGSIIEIEPLSDIGYHLKGSNGIFLN
jgi:hypothetical protein